MGLATVEPSEAMHIGNLLERPMLEDWGAREGLDWLQCPTLQSAEYPFLGATPDGLAMPIGGRTFDRLGQVKIVGQWMADHWKGDEPPPGVIVQVHVEMVVTGLRRVDVIALIGGTARRMFPVYFDADLARGVIAACEAFYRDHMLTGVAPDPDGGARAKAYLMKRFPNVRGEMLPGSVEADAWAERYRAGHRAEKAGKDEKALAANRLRALIGEAPGITGVASLSKGKKGRTLRVTGLEEED